MSGMYVASNIAAIRAQYQLSRNVSALDTTLTRLSTGLKINSGKDDPAGLISSELLRSEISATQQAVSNTERANSIIAVADSALSQVNDLLVSIRTLVVESANTGAMSDDQIAANQLQIDASIDSIDRIARTTTFQGKKLLDGSLDFTTSGVDESVVGDLQIHTANFGLSDHLDVTVKVTETAKKATLHYMGTGVSQDTVINLTGSEGSSLFKFGAETSVQEMATAINAASDSTGVTARVSGTAERGSTVLSSAGANNDILITALETGLDAGNYAFRIVGGNSNDVKIISDPTASELGVVEITLERSYENNFNDFAGLFNITLDTSFAGDDAATVVTSVNMQVGHENSAVFYTEDSAALGTTSSGKTLVVSAVAGDTHMSSYNGWTIKVDDTNGTDDGVIDMDSRTIFITSTGATDTGIGNALQTAMGGSSAATVVLSGQPLVNGEKIVLSGGGDAGELVISYKEGATVGEIQEKINSSAYIQASLANGVTSSQLVPNILSSSTYVTSSGNNRLSDYSSSASAQTVIDLINSKLGDKFYATGLSGEGTHGLVSFMNASATYGSTDLDNAIQFTGSDTSPVVRLVTSGANQELGITIINPSEADIAAGINTRILQINLATDGQGNSISTAKDIVELFNSLPAAQTYGVSAQLLTPDGIDLNGRTWVDDGCGNITILDTCTSDYGNGIVQPSGKAGICEIQQNDVILLGASQSIEEVGYPVARIASATGITSVEAAASDTAETVTIDFGTTSALNGVGFMFTTDPNQQGFNPSSGIMNVYLDTKTMLLTDGEFTSAVSTAINEQLRQNWTAISKFTNTSFPPVTLEGISFANDYTDLLALVDDPTGVLTVGGKPAAPATGKLTSSPISIANMGDETTLTVVVETTTDTGVLNGVRIVMGDSNAWNASTKTLQVAVLTPGQTGDIEAELLASINTAVQLFIDPTVSVTVSVTEADPSGHPVFTIDPATDLYGVTLGTISGGSDGNGTGGELGAGANDPALSITSKVPGTSFSGVDLVFLQDTTLAPGAISVAFDEDSRTMTITGNPTNGLMDATDLANLLNGNDTFLKYCEIIDIERDVTEGATVAFNNTGLPTGVFVGGMKIVTTSGSGTGTSGTATLSNGIAMTGQSDANEHLILEATETGSANFISIQVVEGSFTTYCPMGLAMSDISGTDVKARINSTNAVADGNNISIESTELALSMTIANEIGTTSFTITGGGANFQIGSNVVSTQQLRIGLPSVSSGHLGGNSGKLYQLRTGEVASMSSDEGTKLADRIVNEAISSISIVRGRLGAIQRSTFEPTITVLQDSIEALSSAEALYSNADFARESAALARQQLLVQSGITVLSQARQFPQYASSLIG